MRQDMGTRGLTVFNKKDIFLIESVLWSVECTVQNT